MKQIEMDDFQPKLPGAALKMSAMAAPKISFFMRWTPKGLLRNGSCRSEPGVCARRSGLPITTSLRGLGWSGDRAYPGWMAPRPLIAVPAYRLAPGRVERWPEGGYGVPAPYLEALRRAGARTAVLSPGEVAEPDQLLDPFDGLLLVGGGDVDPARYGAVLGARRASP